jgi:hypothetical protein
MKKAIILAMALVTSISFSATMKLLVDGHEWDGGDIDVNSSFELVLSVEDACGGPYNLSVYISNAIPARVSVGTGDVDWLLAPDPSQWSVDAVGDGVEISSYTGTLDSFGGLQTGSIMTVSFDLAQPAGILDILITGGILPGGNPADITGIFLGGFFDRTPLISSISPNPGGEGQSVTISGSNLDWGPVSVSFYNNVAASISSFTDSSISCTVPLGASSGCITVSHGYGFDTNYYTVPKVTLEKHQITDISGAIKTSFYQGETVRVQLKATNVKSSVPVLAVLNIRDANDTIVYNSHDSGEDSTADSPLNQNETDYYSFDYTIPTDAALGWYDFTGSIRGGQEGTDLWYSVFDTTENGANTRTFGEESWLTNQFEVKEAGMYPEYTLSVTVNGQGTIDLDPPGGIYEEETQVSLTANSGFGWYFTKWEGDLSGSVNPSTILMNRNKSVTAIFKEGVATFNLYVDGNLWNGANDITTESRLTLILGMQTPITTGGLSTNYGIHINNARDVNVISSGEDYINWNIPPQYAINCDVNGYYITISSGSLLFPNIPESNLGQTGKILTIDFTPLCLGTLDIEQFGPWGIIGVTQPDNFYLSVLDGPYFPWLSIEGPLEVIENSSTSYICLDDNPCYQRDFTDMVSWSVDNSNAEISSKGVLRVDEVVSDETVTITASYYDIYLQEPITDTYQVVIKNVPSNILANLNNDKIVNFDDYVIFRNDWISQVCDRADFDKNGRVDSSDLSIFGSYWLEFDGLMSHWPFQSLEGNIAWDIGNHANDCDVIGGPVLVEQPDGSFAIDLDGVDDYLKLDMVNGVFDCAPCSFSISTWINPSEVTGEWRTILEYNRYGQGQPSTNWLGLWLNDNGNVHFRVGGSLLNSKQTLSTDKWYYIAVTYNEYSRLMSIYVNGELDNTYVHEENASWFTVPIKGKLTIGSGGDDEDEFFSGQIDDLRFYNFILPERKIRELNNWPEVTLMESNWPMDSQDNSIAEDIGVMANDCGILGDPDLVEQTNGSYSYDFNGTSDYLKRDVVNGVLDCAPGSFSISTWIYPREVTGGWRTILEYNRPGTNWLGLWLNEANIHFRVGTSGLTSESALTPDTWYYLTATYDYRNQLMSIYINGKLDNTCTYGGVGFSAPVKGKLTIGSGGDNEDEFFSGQVDDLRFYNYVISEKTIQKLNNWPGVDLLEAFWPFESLEEKIAHDVGDKANNCNVIGDPELIEMSDGSFSLDLDGNGDYLRRDGVKGVLDCAPGSFSISTWINPREVNGSWQAMLEYGRPGQNWLGLWLNEEGKVHFRVGRSIFNSISTLAPDTWYYLVVTYNCHNRLMSIYINGELDNTHAYEGVGFTAPENSVLTIGSGGWEEEEYFNGQIDELRFYNYVRNDGFIPDLSFYIDGSPAPSRMFLDIYGDISWPIYKSIEIYAHENTNWVGSIQVRGGIVEGKTYLQNGRSYTNAGYNGSNQPGEYLEYPEYFEWEFSSNGSPQSGIQHSVSYVIDSAIENDFAIGCLILELYFKNRYNNRQLLVDELVYNVNLMDVYALAGGPYQVTPGGIVVLKGCGCCAELEQYDWWIGEPWMEESFFLGSGKQLELSYDELTVNHELSVGSHTVSLVGWYVMVDGSGELLWPAEDIDYTTLEILP